MAIQEHVWEKKGLLLGRSISGLKLHQNEKWSSATMAWVLGIGSSRGADSSCMFSSG